MADKGEQFDPFACVEVSPEDERRLSENCMAWLRSLPKKKPTGPFSVAELSPAERAMDGISDPEQFMADVRAAIADWESGQVAGSDHRDRYMARLAAQLKGE